jgi:hypothetical protein
MPISPTIDIEAVGSGSVSPSGIQTVALGTPLAISATPSDSDHYFVGWQIMGGDITIDNMYAVSAHVTLNSGSTGNIQANFLAYASMTKYSLSDTKTLAGTLKSYLYVDSTLPALTIPSKIHFEDIEKFIAKVDVTAGRADIENVQIDIYEDYTTYPEGFWYKIINNYPTKTINGNIVNCDVQIMFTLMEGSDEVFLFRGSVKRNGTSQQEFKRVGTTAIRGMSIQLVSLLMAMQNIPTNMLTVNTVPFGDPVNTPFVHVDGVVTETFFMSKLGDLLSAIVALTYGFKPGDCVFTNNSTDIQGASSFMTWMKWTDLWFIAGFDFSAPAPAPDIQGGYLDSVHASYAWANKYASALDLMKAICFQFGCVPEYSFGQTDGTIKNDGSDRHLITLNSRGKNQKIVPVGNILDSEYESSSLADSSAMNNPVLNIRFSDILSSGSFTAWIAGVRYDNYPSHVVTIPSNAQFDIDGSVEFFGQVGDESHDTFLLWDTASIGAGSSDGHNISHFRWWNYAFDNGDGTFGKYIDTDTGWYPAIANYYHFRFPGNRPQYTRLYDSLQASITKLDNVIDSYPESNYSADIQFTGAGGNPERYTQSFVADGSVIKSCQFYLKRIGKGWFGGHAGEGSSPDPYPQYCWASVYLDSGSTFGTNSCPAPGAVPLKTSHARLIYHPMDLDVLDPVTGEYSELVTNFRVEKFNFDPNGGSIVSSNVGSGGYAYQVNDVVKVLTNDAVLKILTVDGSGAVLTYQVLNAGTSCIVESSGVSGGNGFNFVVNITAINPLPLQPAAGTKLCLAFEFNNGMVGTLEVDLGVDNTSPTAPGNAAYSNLISGGTFTIDLSNDVIYYVTGDLTKTSIGLMKLLAGHDITDSVNGADETNTYYAAAIEKDILKDQLQVTWVRE